MKENADSMSDQGLLEDQIIDSAVGLLPTFIAVS
jgi:hypothetical protein